MTDQIESGDQDRISPREPERSPRLTPEQQKTADELRRLDPELAQIFLDGFGNLEHIHEPGRARLVAFAGREVGAGFVRLTLPSTAPLSHADAERIAEDERNRANIARVLGLRLDHPLVSAWFDVQKTLQARVHFSQGNVPDPVVVRGAFLTLADLLYGRIGPYFETQAVLDELLGTPEPTTDDVARLGQHLLRPAQRSYFFDELSHVGWIDRLANAGFFGDPPTRLIRQHENTWSARRWPEGEFLARIAPKAPQTVASILKQVPLENDNPAVWDCLTKASRNSPVSCSELLPVLLRVMRSDSIPIFSSGLIDLARDLAQAGDEVAFPLARGLLWLKRLSAPDDEPAISARIVPPRQYSSEWMLGRLSLWEAGEILERVIPHLAVIDPQRTLELLLAKLDLAVRLGEQSAEHRWLSRSAQWCRRLGPKPDRQSDLRCQLAIVAARVARDYASKGSTEARAVLALLDRYDGEIFTRACYLVVASAGDLVPDELDRMVGDPETLDHDYPSGEIAEMLRLQFRNASPAAREDFAASLARGPDRTAYHAVEDADWAEVVEGWQRDRLRWFRNDLPEDLGEFASTIDFEPNRQTRLDQELAEFGVAVSTSAGMYGHASPMAADELASLTPDEFVDFLETWEPAEDGGINPPSVEGLAEAVTEAVQMSPSSAELLVALSGRTLRPAYCRSGISAIRRIQEAGDELPWEAVHALLQTCLARATETLAQSDRMLKGDWDWLAQDAIELVHRLCAEGRAPPDHVDELAAIIDLALDLVAPEEELSQDEATFDGALSAALNSLAGKAVRAAIGLALWQHRLRGKEDGEAEEVERSEARLSHQLDTALKWGGASGVAARTMIGQYVPQLTLVANDWLGANEDALFANGVSEAALAPAWGASLTQGGFYDTVFERLRRWYMDAANATCLGDQTHQSADSHWYLPNYLVSHVASAFIRGLEEIDGADNLVERTFECAPASSLAHAYWLLFRGVSDADAAIPEEREQRLLALWEWRLAALENEPESDERDTEALGLEWFVLMPHLPAEAVVGLAARTLALTNQPSSSKTSLWTRLAELAEVDAEIVCGMIEDLVRRELMSEYPVITFDRAEAAFRAVLSGGGPEASDRLRVVIHKLGEHGFREFGTLL